MNQLLISITTITNTIFLGLFLNYIGFHGYYAGYFVGGLAMTYYFNMIFF